MKPNFFTLALCAILFFTHNIFAQFNPQPNWKDSYKVDGYCFCFTSGPGAYDHGIRNKTVNINGTPYTVPQICEELKKHPRYRAFRNGDIPYNTIQCGNTPYNDAPDEPGCPGRVDIGTAGCNTIGPKWDMAWLESRPIFNGGGGDTGGGTGGGGNDEDNGEIGTAGTGGSGAGQGPRLRVLFPTLNKRITAPATIRVEAEATDANGIQEIELKINGAVVRKERFAPYLWNDKGQDNALSNLPAKNYLLEVKATDKAGNSSIVDILVYVISDTTGGGNDGGNDGSNGGDVTINGQSINKYVSSEGGSRSMRANRNTAGNQEKFIVAQAGNGTVSFKGNNGKYVSSENGNKAMNCNRNAVGAWEKFTLESLGGDLYAIKGNNGKYVSHENGNDKGIFCNRNAVGAWEKFVIKGLTANRNSIATKINAPQEIKVYPNPATKDEIQLKVNVANDVQSFVEIVDLNGKSIATKDLGVLKAGTSAITMQDILTKINQSGLYLVRITLGEKTIVKQLMIK